MEIQRSILNFDCLTLCTKATFFIEAKIRKILNNVQCFNFHYRRGANQIDLAWQLGALDQTYFVSEDLIWTKSSVMFWILHIGWVSHKAKTYSLVHLVKYIFNIPVWVFKLKILGDVVDNFWCDIIMQKKSIAKHLVSILLCIHSDIS